jgi:PAS domain S-box-containing protein
MSLQTAKSVAHIPPSLNQQAQKAWREGATFERAGVGIVEIDRDGAILRANRHFRDYLHCPVDEIIGRSVFEFMHPGDADKDRQQLRRQVDNERHGYTLEGRLQLLNGQTRWVNISSTSVCDNEGRFAYAVRVHQDITERKQFEENLAIYSTDQEVLHHLSARVQRAGSVDDICSAAMDAMSRSLRCARASVLLLDEQGQMRFVAARGLSPAYMAAVEGHSPWPADARDVQSVCIGNVRDHEIAADLKKTVLDEGIEAIAFIPLIDAARLLGKFMIYYDEPHRFSIRENEMARTIARHVSFGLERLKSQRAARHLAAIVESSTDAIVSKNLDAVITSWNQGAERLFGYTAAEAVGQPVTMLIPPDQLTEEPAILARIRAGERVEHFETVRRHKSGRLIDISLTISPIRDENVDAIVGASKIARDISDQKAAQRRLQENEMRLQELLSAIPAAIYTTDAKGKITYFNEAAVEFAGRRPEIGSDEWCVSWKLFWPDGRPLPLEQCPMALCLKEGRPIRGVEAVAERPDGSRVPFIPCLCENAKSDSALGGMAGGERWVVSSKAESAINSRCCRQALRTTLSRTILFAS